MLDLTVLTKIAIIRFRQNGCVGVCLEMDAIFLRTAVDQPDILCVKSSSVEGSACIYIVDLRAIVGTEIDALPSGQTEVLHQMKRTGERPSG